MEIEFTGARVLLYIPKLGGVVLTQTIVTMWIVMAVIVGLCIFLTHGMEVHARTKRQIVAEWIVTKVNGLIRENMGEKFMGYAPFIAAILSLSALCSLTSLCGAYAPTSDISALIGWGLLVFVLITYTKLKTNGLLGYLKGYTKPIPVLTPFNIISEIATPLSMVCRHFGNIASGGVIMGLLKAALGALSALILSKLPGILGTILGQIPILQIGIPVVLSLYFDIFSSLLQAYIFCMLTMLYISSAAEED